MKQVASVTYNGLGDMSRFFRNVREFQLQGFECTVVGAPKFLHLSG